MLRTCAPLAAAAILLAGCGGGSTTTAPPATVASAPKPAPKPSVTVVIRNFKYRPATLRVKAGSRVTWRNDDSSPHTATARGGGFTTRELTQGQSRTLTLRRPGHFSYVCIFHAFMRGTLIVTPR